jgi:regulator of CtrA degradation
VKLSGLSTAMHGAGWDGLPVRLRDLITRSLRVQERVLRLDDAFGTNGPPAVDNPVREQLGRIAQAFAASR